MAFPIHFLQFTETIPTLTAACMIKSRSETCREMRPLSNHLIFCPLLIGAGHKDVVFWSGKKPGFWVVAAAVGLFALVTRVRPGMPLASNQGSLWELLFLYWQSWGSEVRHQNWKGSQVPSEILSSESFWGRNWTCVTQSLRMVSLI